MSNNVINYIRKHDNISILRQIYCNKKYKYDELSDFEIFRLWEQSRDLMKGHRALGEYDRIIGTYGLDPVTPYSCDAVCKRWTALFGYTEDVASCVYSDVKISEFKREIYGYSEVDVLEIVSKNAKRYNDLSSLVKSEIIDNIHDKNAVTAIYIDYYGCEYARPDIRSAEIAFKKFKCDELLNSEEKFILLSEAVILTVLKNNNAVLRFDLRNGDCVRRFLSYVLKNHLFCGKAFGSVGNREELSVLSNILEEIEFAIPFIPYVSGVSIGREDDDELLRHMFSVYPIGGFCLNKILTEDFTEKWIEIEKEVK